MKINFVSLNASNTLFRKQCASHHHKENDDLSLIVSQTEQETVFDKYQ